VQAREHGHPSASPQMTSEGTAVQRGRGTHVALVVYPGCSLLELIGAQTIWATASMMSSLHTVVVGPSTSFIESTTALSFRPQRSFAEVPHPDVLLVVGGGEASEVATGHAELLTYLRRVAPRASVVASTGSGSLVLAAAGLLEGREATTHWAFREQLEALGVSYRRASWVADGKFVTGAGSSAAIDLSLLLVARLRTRRLARRTQIAAEWDPDPPFGGIDWAAVDTAAPLPARASHDGEPRRVALVIYEGLTVLDLVGPLEVVTGLSRLRPEFVPVVVADQVTPVRSDSGLAFQPNRSFEDLADPEVVIVPGGGLPTLRAMSNRALRRYLSSASATATCTASVCTGALLLGSVGLLTGRDAPTHWAYRSYLPALGGRAGGGPRGGGAGGGPRPPHDEPTVWLITGVNGTGKTTSIGKLAAQEARAGRTVVVAAADTFRAAAVDQLALWAERAGARLVSHDPGADPAAVAYDALMAAEATDADTVIVDTAGRLHNKRALMDELSKVKRVLEKRGGEVDEVLLVLDATTGQNGIPQARAFLEAVEVSGLLLTKLDGTSKGGIVVAVQRELELPVKLVGIGEGLDDLAPFDPVAFVDAVFG
jgi:signal recognition particle-docking protein FtsY